MKIFKRLVIWLIVIIFSLVLINIVLAPIKMGEGSEKYAIEWTEKFKPLDSIESAQKKYPDIKSYIFENGDWVFGICKDSHSSSQGGTIVIKESSGKIRCFFGHVCGSGYLSSAFHYKKYKNPEEIYRILISRSFIERLEQK